MIEVQQTESFKSWVSTLRDRKARAVIAQRIERVRLGNLGDAKAIGGGVSELRIMFGPGYRLYFARRGDTLIILLCGGDKGSQARDIATAKEILAGIG